MAYNKIEYIHTHINYFKARSSIILYRGKRGLKCCKRYKKKKTVKNIGNPQCHHTGGGPLCRSPVYGHSNCWMEVHETPGPTGAPSTGLWKDRPVRKPASVTNKNAATIQITSGLLMLVIDCLTSDVQDQMRLYLDSGLVGGGVFKLNFLTCSSFISSTNSVLGSSS